MHPSSATSTQQLRIHLYHLDIERDDRVYIPRAPNRAATLLTLRGGTHKPPTTTTIPKQTKQTKGAERSHCRRGRGVPLPFFLRLFRLRVSPHHTIPHTGFLRDASDAYMYRHAGAAVGGGRDDGAVLRERERERMRGEITTVYTPAIRDTGLHRWMDGGWGMVIEALGVVGGCRQTSGLTGWRGGWRGCR